MGKPGIIAFPVLLALGAITGYLTYTYFTAAIPHEGFVDSPYRQELNPAEATEDESKVLDESQFSKVVTIKILEGASVQGSPDFDPDTAAAGADALITWVNNDAVPHTATSGKGQGDSDAGELFDSGILTQGQKFSVSAADLGEGEHKYYCTVHPYMTSTITVE
jgi:plastocyanin